MQGNRFTIYDALAKNGYFDANPANSYSRDKTTGDSLYQGPVEFPKALFHPEGEERIIVAAEIIMTPMGPKAVGEQRELIFQIVPNKKEEDALRAEGWWDHPAKAVRRRVELFIEKNEQLPEKEKKKLLGAIPSISSDARIKELERELARLTSAPEAEPTPAKPAPAPVAGATLQPLATANSLGARFGSEHSPSPG